MKVSALKKKAVATGVPPEQLEDADDSDDPKAALINSLLEVYAKDLLAESTSTLGSKLAQASTHRRSRPADNPVGLADVAYVTAQLEHAIALLDARIPGASRKARAELKSLETPYSLHRVY